MFFYFFSFGFCDIRVCFWLTDWMNERETATLGWTGKYIELSVCDEGIGEPDTYREYETAHAYKHKIHIIIIISSMSSSSSGSNGDTNSIIISVHTDIPRFCCSFGSLVGFGKIGSTGGVPNCVAKCSLHRAWCRFDEPRSFSNLHTAQRENQTNSSSQQLNFNHIFHID